MGKEMKRVAELLESSDANYSDQYIDKIMSIGIKLINKKSDYETIGSRDDFGKMFSQAFPKGLSDFDDSIIWLFADISKFCRKHKDHSKRKDKVEEYVHNKIVKRKYRNDNINMNSNNKQDVSDKSNDTMVKTQTKDDSNVYLDNNNGHISGVGGINGINYIGNMDNYRNNIYNNNNNDNNDNNSNNSNNNGINDESGELENNGRNEEEEKKEIQDNTLSSKKSKKYKKKMRLRERVDQSNNSNAIPTDSVTYWVDIEKQTMKNVDIDISIKNNPNFAKIHSNESRHVLANEIYYAFLKMIQDPSIDRYKAYPRSRKNSIISRQILLMLLILDCDKFDELFKKHNFSNIEEPCLEMLRQLKKHKRWENDKNIRKHTKLKFLFHWYSCTFGVFWNSTNKI